MSTVKLRLYKEEYFTNEDIKYSFDDNSLRRQGFKPKDAEIVYQINVSYEYNKESLLLYKKYEVNEKTKNYDYQQSKGLDEETNQWIFKAPKTDNPTFRYDNNQTDRLQISIRCFFKLNYQIGEKVESTEEEIQIVERSQNQNTQAAEKYEIHSSSDQIENPIEESKKHTLNTRYFFKPNEYTLQLSVESISNNQINLIYKGDEDRKTDIQVKYQLCFEFAIQHTTIVRKILNACPRFLLDQQEVKLDNNGNARISIPLLQGKTIPPKIRFADFLSCEHYIVLQITFLNQRCFKEDPCEIKIPINIQKQQSNANQQQHPEIYSFKYVQGMLHKLQFCHLQTSQVYKVP